MKKLCIFVSLLSLALVFPALAANLDNAKTLYEEKKYEPAISELKQIFESSKGDARFDALLHIIRCDYFLKNHAEIDSYYKTYKNEAKNSPFEPDIHFEYAKSLMDNAKDYASARAIYEMVYRDFPNTIFAGPGSLLKLGDIDVIEKKPQEALTRYNELETKYPDCPYIDNAYLGKVKAYIALKDRTSLLNAVKNIRKRFPNNNCTAIAGIEAGIYFARIERQRHLAIRHFRDVANDYKDTHFGALAELRLADLAEGSQLKKSIALYKKVLSKPELLRGTQKYWAQTELGVNLFLNEEKDKATTELQKVIDSDAPKKFKERANLHLEAINDPKSLSAALVHIDAAVRYRRDFHAFDTAYWSFRVYTDAWKAGKFDEFLKDPNIPDEEKAKREYQLSLAYYHISYVKQSDIQAQRVVEKYPNVDYYCASVKYSLAHHKELGNKFEDAIEGYMSILEQYPNIDFAPQVMRKIGDCFILMDREAEAVYVYDSLAKLYPYRREGIGGEEAKNFVLKAKPELVKALEKAKESGGKSLSMKKMPPSQTMKLPTITILERLDRMKEKLLLAMAKDKGETFEDLVTDIK